MASALQYGRPASWPQPGIRSQCPPLGPLELMRRHKPVHVLALCSTQVTFACGGGTTDGRSTVQSTHLNVNAVADVVTTSVARQLALEEEMDAVPVPVPTNEVRQTSPGVPPVMTLMAPGILNSVSSPKSEAVAPKVALRRSSLRVYVGCPLSAAVAAQERVANTIAVAANCVAGILTAVSAALGAIYDVAKQPPAGQITAKLVSVVELRGLFHGRKSG